MSNTVIDAPIDQIEPPTAARRHTPNLHICGYEGRDVSRKIVNEVKTPDGTKSWQPIAHSSFIEQVERVLKHNRVKVGESVHRLSHEGNRYFGLMAIEAAGDLLSEQQDYCWILGLRNSHDKTFPAGLVAGASVFVCDNLSFSGDVKITRKHTARIFDDLPGRVEAGIGELLGRFHGQQKRFDAYKQFELTDAQVHDILVCSVDLGAIPNQALPKVLAQWRKPAHEEFAPRTAWSLFNDYTEVLKATNLIELPRRTQVLHGLLDSRVGLGDLALPA